MGRDSRSTRRSWNPAALVIAAAGFAVIAVASAFVTAHLIAPPPPRVAVPGQDTFENLRVADADVVSLGLSASESGHLPSTLAVVVARMETDWRAARGTPDPCLFAGTYRGISRLPVWGTENESDTMWDRDAVSATQTLAAAGEATSFATVSTRIFDTEQSAAAFVSEHDQKVAGCPEFSTTNVGLTATTTVTPLPLDTVPVAAAGWLASTDKWIAPGESPDTAEDMLCWVVDLQHSNVVQRLTVVAPASRKADIALLVDELVVVVARKLVMAVASSD